MKTRWFPLLAGVFFLLAGLRLSGCTEKPKDETCAQPADCPKTHFCSRKSDKCEPNIECSANDECLSGHCVEGKCCGDKGRPCPEPQPEPVPREEPPPVEPPPAEEQALPEKGREPEPNPCGNRKRCISDSNCTATGERCENGCCTDVCTNDEDCGGAVDCSKDCTAMRLVCINQRCQQQICSCPKGQKCDASGSKKCVPFCEDPPCKGTTCPQGKAPNPAEKCKCSLTLRAPCERCTRHAECGPGNRCAKMANDKRCLQGCCEGSCPSGTRCTERIAEGSDLCVPSSGKCPCQGVKCPEKQKCCLKTERCQQCCSDTDCPPSGGDPKKTVCHNVTYSCVGPCEARQCPQFEKCDPSDGKCKCRGKVCTSGQKCFPNYGCAPDCGTCKSGYKCCSHNREVPKCNYNSRCCFQQCPNYCYFGNCK